MKKRAAGLPNRRLQARRGSWVDCVTQETRPRGGREAAPVLNLVRASSFLPRSPPTDDRAGQEDKRYGGQ
jgi:hypothetical protein